MDRDPTQSGPASQPSQEPGSPSVLEDTLKDLSAKSTLDMFRVFFDIKNEYWKAFRERLHQFVTTNYSWDIILKDVKQRRVCAEKFLQEVGVEYWGTPENREKYLEKKSIESGQVCIYPDDKRPLVVAFGFLLERRARWPKPQPQCDDQTAQQDMTSTPDNATDAPAASSSMSQNINTPVASPRVPTNLSPVFAGVAPKLEPQSQSHSPLTSLGRRERIQASLERNPFIGDIHNHRLSTYFLIRSADGDDQQGPVSLTWTNYPNANKLLDAMADRVAEADEDEVVKQMRRESPQIEHRHEQRERAISAAVRLRWSNNYFMIRRNTNDLQELHNRVDSAWRAKDRNELEVLEFVIEATLNMEKS